MVMTPDWLELLPRVLAHFGEPFADSSALPTWLVAQAAREHVTVALSGDGGDELFAGYTWLHRTLRTARWHSLPSWVRASAVRAGALLPDRPLGHRLRRAASDLELSPRAIHRRRSSCYERRRLTQLLDPGLLAAMESTDRFEEHAGQAASLALGDWILHQDLTMYLPDDVLTKVDRMSMAHSLEVRVPLLDHRMVEFACTVPFELKFSRGISKRVMKTAMKDLLPPRVLAQRKRGFAIPIQRWFRSELGRHFEALLLRERSRCADWINMEYVRSLFEEHRDGRENHGHRLWAILALEHWLREST